MNDDSKMGSNPDKKFSDFKTMVMVKLELLRGCCQAHKGPTKKQIGKSIEEFIKKLETEK